MLEVITDRKEKEAAETRACSGKPMLAVRWPFVIQMSRLYTRAAFRLFEEALQDSTDLRISQDHDFRNGWIVSHTKRMFCTHMLRAFVHVQLEKIPAAYILKRYTKKVKSDVPFDRHDREATGPMVFKKITGQT
ncbi:Os06g0517150 [Oryza sativa Japonica Group]|uniref:Protein FAR1-RELATED SEQUENCE n=1 Tax=Oryza sativa subsp. japonica TaxID=39947 RepID=A0A0N7KM70_ORYSJ|nr:Os06g0517150 [Oryza sativa Japonica Group]